MYNPKLPDQKLLSNGQWNATCPFCGKKAHFYMNSNNGLFDCKKCGEVGNWYKFVKFIKTGVKEEEQKQAKKNLLKVDIDILSAKKSSEENLPALKEELPKEFKRISMYKTPEAYQYLVQKRKFTMFQISKYDIRYCYIGRFWNRVIIPIYMFGELYGYLGRFVPIEGINVSRKYLNSYGTDFSKLLWNYDGIKNDKTVIITEGVFSAMRIDNNVTCTFGKKISKYQIELLKLKNVKSVLLFFDADALNEINKYGGKLLEHFEEVRVYPLQPGEDIDDFDNFDGKLYNRILKKSRLYDYAHLVYTHLVK